MNTNESKQSKLLPCGKDADWNKNQNNKHKVKSGGIMECGANESNSQSSLKSAPPHGNQASPTSSTTPNPRSQSSQNSTNPTVQHSTAKQTTQTKTGPDNLALVQLTVSGQTTGTHSRESNREISKKTKYLNGSKDAAKLREHENLNSAHQDRNGLEVAIDKKSANLANSTNIRRDGHSDDKERPEKTTAEVGTLTEPECLAPCDAGTEVHLSGIIWHESESGMLVVNVTWRNRSYVGTLLDASRHDWAPPRLADGKPDSSHQQRAPTRRGKHRNEKKFGRATRGQREETLNGQMHSGRGKVKRVSPNDQENNSDDYGKPAIKKIRTGCLHVAASEGADSKKHINGGRDSPIPVGGYYVCEEEECERKFKNIEALQYHKPKCKKALVPDKEKDHESKKTKIEVKNETTCVESGVDVMVGNLEFNPGCPSGNSADVKKEQLDSHEDSENDTAREVAHTLLDLKNDPSHEQNGPPSLTQPPPQLAKRPDNPKTAADNKIVNTSTQPRMPPLQKKPLGTDLLPPMPLLQPKPGLIHSTPTTPVLQQSGSVTGTPGTPIKTRLNSASPQPIPGSAGDNTSPTQNETSKIVLNEMSLKRAPSPFKPVNEHPPSPTTQNARASPAFSDISEPGDDSNLISDKEKEIEKEKSLKSSLAFKNSQFQVTTQFNTSMQVHQRYNDNQQNINYPHISRDEKKEAKVDDKETKIVKNEFKSGLEKQEQNRLPPVASSTHENRQKPHQSEPKKPTATITPMNSSNERKVDQKIGSSKQHTPKKDQTPQALQLKSTVSQATGMPPTMSMMTLQPPFCGFSPMGHQAFPYPGITFAPGTAYFHPPIQPVVPSPHPSKRMDGKQISNPESRQAVSPSPSRSYYPSQPQPSPFSHYGATYGLHPQKK